MNVSYHICKYLNSYYLFFLLKTKAVYYLYRFDEIILSNNQLFQIWTFACSVIKGKTLLLKVKIGDFILKQFKKGKSLQIFIYCAKNNDSKVMIERAINEK